MLRSVDTSCRRLIPGKRRGWREPQSRPEKADKFMLQEFATGFAVEAISRMMKWNPKQAAYRLRMLKGMGK